MVSHLVPEILTFAYAWINDISQNKSYTRIHMWCFVRHQGNVFLKIFFMWKITAENESSSVHAVPYCITMAPFHSQRKCTFIWPLPTSTVTCTDQISWQYSVVLAVHQMTIGCMWLCPQIQFYQQQTSTLYDAARSHDQDTPHSDTVSWVDWTHQTQKYFISPFIAAAH